MGALSALTLGAYVPIWFGLTWAEIRRETADPRKLPLAHALGTLLPGWNALQTHRHFRAINELLEKAGLPGRADPTSAALGLVIWWLTFTHYSSDPLFLALDAIELAAGTAVVVYGQRALNAYWAAKGAAERVLETDMLALALALMYAVVSLLGLLSSPP